MFAKELIEKLTALPPNRLVCVDVTDLGFIDVADVHDDPEDPGALILIEDKGEMPDLVRAINGGRYIGNESLVGIKLAVRSTVDHDVTITLAETDTLSFATSDGRQYRAMIDDGEIVLRRVDGTRDPITSVEVPKVTTRTWTEHTFRCLSCKRVARASQETIDEMRRELDYGDPNITDAGIAATLDLCLACVDGEPGPEGEHVALVDWDGATVRAERACPASVLVWMQDDRVHASAEGWDLYNIETGDCEIEKEDDDGTFASDNEAISHVITKAEAGSEPHLRALAIVRRDNPLEWADIVHGCDTETDLHAMLDRHFTIDG